MTEDDICGEVLSPEVQAMLLELRQRGRVPLAAVRRVLRQRPRLDCQHPADERMQLYADRDYCRVCGKVVER